MINDKILVIGDIHLGVNKNNPIFFDTALKYAEWVSNECKSRGITQIVQLGDIFHNDNVLHLTTLNGAYKFFERLKHLDIHIITGNHDVLYRSISEVHSLKLLSNWPNITVHDGVTTIGNVTFCGWGAKLEDIPESQDIIFGHFDIRGFLLTGTKVSEHGFSGSEIMDKCRLLMTGHYHKPQIRFYNKKPLVYTGSAYQLNWGESGEDKFLYEVDTRTLQYTPIKNTISPRFEYINSESDFSKIANNFVTVNVANSDEINSKTIAFRNLNALDVRTTLVKSNNIVDKDKLEKSIDDFKGIRVDDMILEYVKLLPEFTVEEKKMIADIAIEMYSRVS